MYDTDGGPGKAKGGLFCTIGASSLFLCVKLNSLVDRDD